MTTFPLIQRIRLATILVILLTSSTGFHLKVESAPTSPGRPKVNVRSNVSNINIGNVKKTNVNVYDKNYQGPAAGDSVSSPSATPNFNLENTPIDIQSILGKGFSNKLSIGNKSGKPGGPIDISAVLKSLSGSGGAETSSTAEAKISAQLSKQTSPPPPPPPPAAAATAAAAAEATPSTSRPAWARETIENPGIVASASTHTSSIRRIAAPKKVKKTATEEQLEMKNRLLELAAKATSIPDGDGPMLKYNPQLGKYETVEVDPDAKIYKEMLREALDALSAKKLSAKKLKKVLGDLEAAQPDSLEPQEPPAAPEPEPEPEPAPEPEPEPSPPAAVESKVAEPLKYILKSGSQRNLFDIYNTPIKIEEEEPAAEEEKAPEPEPAPEEAPAAPAHVEEAAKEARRKIESWLGNKWDQGRNGALAQSAAEAPPAPEPEPAAPVDEERKKLVDEVRFQLDDRINRISDLLYFRSEFLNLLLNVDDASELTPIESVFKRMVLCNSDEQFCLQPDLSPAKEAADEAKADEEEEKKEEAAKEEEAKKEEEKESDDYELHLNPYWQATTFSGYTPNYIRHHQMHAEPKDGAVAAAAAAHAKHAQVAAKAHAEAAAAAAAAHDAAMAASEEAAKRHADHLATFNWKPAPMPEMPPMPGMPPMPTPLAFPDPPAWASDFGRGIAQTMASAQASS